MKTWLRWGVALAYVVMITMNVLANALPLNGMTTGEISDRYWNLFAPTGLTFSIWGVIYTGLGIYVLMQWSQRDVMRDERISILFIINALLNSIWIVLWHYDAIILSMIVMIGLLISLIWIVFLTAQKDIVVRTIFEIYFGWITVATIANATVLAVAMRWGNPGNELWMFIILWIGLVIALFTAYRFQSIAYISVILWAYIGILIKHVVTLNGDYQVIVVTLWGMVAILSSMIVFMMYPKAKAGLKAS